TGWPASQPNWRGGLRQGLAERNFPDSLVDDSSGNELAVGSDLIDPDTGVARFLRVSDRVELDHRGRVVVERVRVLQRHAFGPLREDQREPLTQLLVPASQL